MRINAFKFFTTSFLLVLGLTVNATTFNEGFEANQTGSYSAANVTGDACIWNLSNAGVYTDAANSHQGSHSLRLGTNSNSYAAMAENKSDGAASISFYGRSWSSSDGTATIQVQYSTDNGATWSTAGTATLATTTYNKYSYNINISGDIRIKFNQTAGKRAIIDDVTITDYAASSSGVFTSPASGSMVDFGTCAANTTAQQSIIVKGSGFTSATSVAVSGTGFSANTTALSAAKVNSTAGATVQLNFKGANGGSYTGTLTLTNGSTVIKVTLKATVSGSSSSQAAFSSPANGSTIDFGSVTVNKTQTSTVIVQGANLSSSTTVSVSGTGFSAGATTLSAAKVNSTTGAQLQINFKSASAGTFNGTLKLSSGSLTRTVALTAKAVSGSDSGSSDSGSTGGSSGATSGDIPTGYYTSCENKYGAALLTALCSKVSSHTTISYSGLWSAFKSADTKDNGKIWDMYSTKEFTYSTNQCGTYSKIGDCYNREHSFPKSWFNDATPMYTDLFHIYPTDGYVNNQRSNYPFGECNGGTYVASSGSVKPLGKLGKSTIAGYSGTVWEPEDEYKGDFARSYFYMIAAYNDRITGWSSDMLDGTKYPGFSSWAINMLLNWNALDPVSQKEIDRNEAVYALHKNRNPFIDHPELADYIWGAKKSTAWTEGSATATATFSYPADGSTLSFGTTATGSTNEKIIKVKGTGLSGNITATVEGDGFVSAEVLNSSTTQNVKARTAEATDDSDSGIHVRIIFTPEVAANYNGRLILSDGEAVSNVNLTSKALDGLPAADAENITTSSFVARWVEVGDMFDDGTYRLVVSDANGPLEGFPAYVNAEDLTYEVSGLDAATQYTYSLTSKTAQSNIVIVTTLDAQPSIFFVFDPDEMLLKTEADTPSDIVEILLEGENLTGDITFAVSAPFEVSINGLDWATTVTAPKSVESVYIRLGATSAGEYITSLKAYSGTYFNDVVTVQGSVTADALVEDFEKYQTNSGTYSDKTYSGNATQWNLHDAGIWSSDTPYEGKYCLRLGNKADSYIEMVNLLSGGISRVSFYARKWNDREDDATVLLQYTDKENGEWYTLASFDITSSDYTCFASDKVVTGPVKIRIAQSAGARIMLDYIEIAGAKSNISDINATGIKITSSAGAIDITTDTLMPVSIYTIDGTILVNAEPLKGKRSFAIPSAGIYIVAVGDTAKRLIVRR